MITADALDKVLVLDFGSQYTQLIARRIREQRVYSEIWPCTRSLDDVRAFNPRAIILSGGPSSVHEEGSPTVDPAIFELGVPVLGICYGMQLMSHLLGGRVERAPHHEYGRADLELTAANPLFQGFQVGGREHVWMSHGDSVQTLPEGFEVVGASPSCPFAAVANTARDLYGLQFHPEVVHSPRGAEILGNFLFRIAHLTANWTMGGFIEREIEDVVEGGQAGQASAGAYGGSGHAGDAGGGS